MEFYLFVLILLFLTAAADLMVGVANDAVNFLNSAVGSKAGRRATIMIVASIGVFVGTTFSGGIMEVARKGIFNPEYYVFHDVMVIFLAVMLTDIILLDLYNTFGLPTSTTVSVVFELIGGSVAIATVKVAGSGGGIADVLSYINTANVLTIVSSIGLSIVFAFVFGSLTQFITRLIFTFDYERPLRRWGGLYCGAALTMITYFILVKGAKGSVLIDDESQTWILTHIAGILGASFVVWSMIWFAVIRFTRINVLKIIVLIGTFALALAFAANDLVNFIGAPMGALAAYTVAAATPGMDPMTLGMEALGRPVAVNPLILMAAGAVMVGTLWVSRKARTVTNTEVTLGRQDEGVERFQATALSRGIVRMAVTVHQAYKLFAPRSVRAFVRRRLDSSSFNPEADPDGKHASFDLLRAAVNLMVGASLISFGTSLKLPLSTTFVTFMVAMATSFVDGAWGRESAVYRLNGVITVIGGWFFTAFMAFTACFLFSLAIYFGGIPAILALVAVGLGFYWRTTLLHRKRETEFDRLERERMTEVETGGRFGKVMRQVAAFVSATRGTIDLCYGALINERRKKLKEAKRAAAEIAREGDRIVNTIFQLTRSSVSEDGGLVPLYAQKIGALQIISANLQSLTASAFNHIDNHHSPPDSSQAEELDRVNGMVGAILKEAAHAMEHHSFGDQERLTAAVLELKETIRGFDKNQMKRIKAGKSGTRQSLLFIGTMSKAERIADQTVQLLQLFQESLLEDHA